MTLTATEARERIEGVLKAAGIKLSAFAYAEYGYEAWIDVTVEFPDGAKFDGDLAELECDGISHQRG